MSGKTCDTCISNDNWLCDRKGILIEGDDTCENHTKNCMDSLMEKFIRKSMRQGRKCPCQTGRWLNDKGELDSIRNRYVR